MWLYNRDSCRTTSNKADTPLTRKQAPLYVTLPDEFTAATGRPLCGYSASRFEYSRVKFVVHYFLGRSLFGVRPQPPEFRSNWRRRARQRFSGRACRVSMVVMSTKRSEVSHVFNLLIFTHLRRALSKIKKKPTNKYEAKTPNKICLTFYSSSFWTFRHNKYTLVPLWSGNYSFLKVWWIIRNPATSAQTYVRAHTPPHKCSLITNKSGGFITASGVLWYAASPVSSLSIPLLVICSCGNFKQ